MSNRRSILKEFAVYATSAYAAQLLDFINGILTRRFLGPSHMGIWSFLQVIVGYSKYSLLGTVQVANKQIPYLLGKGLSNEAEELKNSVYAFSIVSGIINAVVCVVYGLFRKEVVDLPFFLGLIASAMIIYSQRIYNYSVVVLRITKKFGFISKLMIFSSAFTVVLTIGLTIPFGFYGFLVSQVVIYWINLAFIEKFNSPRFKYKWNWPLLKSTFKLGFSLILCQAAYTILTTLDRIVIAKMLGFHDLGIFSVAIMANTYILSFPNMAGIVLFPYYQEKFAAKDSIEDLKSYVLFPTATLTFLLPFLLAAVWFLSPLLFYFFLPEYKDGLLPLRIFILASYFLCMTHHFNIFLITVNKEMRLFASTVAATLLALGGLIFVVSKGWGILGVSVVETVIYALYLFMLLFFSLRYYVGIWAMTAIMLRILGVAAYSAVGFFIIDKPDFFLQNYVALSAVKCLVAFIYLSPLLFFAERETQVLAHIWSIVKEKLNRRESRGS